jgi:hypothetical protein
VGGRPVASSQLQNTGSNIALDQSARAVRWLSPENGEAEQEQIKAAHQDAEEYPQTWMGECPKSKRASKSSTINHGSTAKKKKPS